MSVVSVVQLLRLGSKRSERSAIITIEEVLVRFPISIYTEYYLLLRVSYLTYYLI